MVRAFVRSLLMQAPLKRGCLKRTFCKFVADGKIRVVLYNRPKLVLLLFTKAGTNCDSAVVTLAELECI